jgi:hypothetical protein
MQNPDPPPTDADTARQLAQMKTEPLLAAEKWLIGGSLTLGAALLGVLLWVTRTYFAIAS